MKLRLACILSAACTLLSSGSDGSWEYRVAEPVFAGDRVVDVGGPDSTAREFTVLLTLEAAIRRDGVYAYAAKKEDGRGELQWAIYRAGWNDRFGFYFNTSPEPLFVHAPPGIFANGLHAVAAVVAADTVRLYCDGKEVASGSLEGRSFAPAAGRLLLGAADDQATHAFRGRIAEVKFIPRALTAKEVEYAFGTPRRPTVKVFTAPLSPTPGRDEARFAPTTEHDALTALQVMDWRIAPEADAAELNAIAAMVRAKGFDALFVGGSFRYLFAERYGDRNWWATIPWPTYLATLARLDRACDQAGVRLVMHLTANLGLFPDLEREFAGLTSRELSDPEREFDWPNYSGKPLCANNPDFQAKYLARLQELFAAAPHLGGLMIDEVSFGPAYTGCGCRYCVAAFAERYEMTPPDPDDDAVWRNFQSARWRNWLLFRCASTRDYMRLLADAVAASGAGRVFTSCNYNPASAHIPTMHGINQLHYAGNLLFYEYEPCHPWSWRHGIAEGKFLQSDGRPLLLQGYAGSISQAYFQLLLSAVMSWGNSQWTEFNGYRILPVDWFRFWRPLSYGLSSPAKIALVVAPNDNTVSDYNQQQGNAPKEYFGWAEALTEAHVLFDVIRTDAVAADCQYELLIAPNTMCWSDAELAAMQAFLDRGGALIATGESFSLTPAGDARPRPEWRGAVKTVTECYGEAYYAPKIGGGWYGNGSAWYVSAQPAASVFEIADVLCSSVTPNNRRTAWDVKDVIIGWSSWRSIGKAD